MGIYFDTCCYNRPFDDPSCPRIRREAGAILRIRGWCRHCGHDIFSSAALDEEIDLISDVDKHRDVLRFYRQTVTARAFCMGRYNMKMSIDITNPTELWEAGLLALDDALGADAADAFMELKFSGHGDYTAEKRTRPIVSADVIERIIARGKSDANT